MNGPPTSRKSTDLPAPGGERNLLTRRSLDDLGGDDEDFTPPLEIFLRRVSVTDDDHDPLDFSSASAFTQSTLDGDSLHKTSSHGAPNEGYLSATSSVSSLADNIYRAYTSAGGGENQAPQRIRRTPIRRQSSRKRRQRAVRKGGLTRWSSMPRQRDGGARRNQILSGSEHAPTIGTSEFSPRPPRRQGSISGELNDHERTFGASNREHMPRIPTRKISTRSLGSDSDSDDDSSSAEIIVSAYAA